MVANVLRYPFEISVDNSELVKVYHPRHDLSKLKDIKDRKGEIRGETVSGLTNSKRFAFVLDLVYSVAFPLRIHSETIRKCWGFAEIETPNNGKMFGWCRRFQAMISWQNR